ncbi:DUF1223 domain-containing protein [Vibrio splendidus]|uniref:DUF1223 domain-containing protein n=1 Tax=Vibrio splendidus TaxID=29497 RepID=UPI000C846B10|nr:DUF1223 domain-containing protein [Vibrio splendidus]PMJ76880.1 hypothetical protein BCU23_14080 [Vibrio splendidus]
MSHATRNSSLIKLCLLALPIGAYSPVSLAQTWSNEGQPAQVIELFTSEGCSSCPPADTYLSTFADHPKLWTEVIPLAYHVDYWDYLGWGDKFASKAFSQKLRLYKAYGVTSGVYTPGFVVDGKEWRGYFNWLDRTLPSLQQQTNPKLTVNHKGDTFNVSYEGKGDYVAHIALLAMNEVTSVKAGENRGKKLKHDFVVVYDGYQRGESDWQFNIDLSPLVATPDAVAVWLTELNSYTPEQTVAGWLN